MRVSDADRDRAVAELSEQFQIGRLTQDEFGDRSGRALQARTGDELRALFADLPSGPGAVTGAAAGPAPDDEPPFGAMDSVGGNFPARRGPRARYVVLLVIAVIIASSRVVVSGHQVHYTYGLLVPVLVIFFLMRRFSRR